jgi:glycosyltransferase involved in cell wall biosynthesis
MEVRERLALSLARRAEGFTEWTLEANRFYGLNRAEISVVITSYNYGHFLAECLQSVVGSEYAHAKLEIVVVDDASTDQSATMASALLSTLQIPTILVTKVRNTGLADARNVGVYVSCGALVLTLDADNLIFPRCLSALAAALADPQVTASYPILQRFSEDSRAGSGLVSERPWNVRDLVRGPYIDALAMFRRDVLLSVGGYSTELIEHGWFGWEDYDLWLKLAAAGHAVVQVPEVLAAYRVHPHSMIRQTNRDVMAIGLHLAQKFKALAEAEPGLPGMFGYVPTAPPPAVRRVRWERMDDRSIPQQPREIRAIVTVRNEIDRLPHLLDQHRRLGIDRFLIVDNNSTDGSADYLLTQPDVHVFWTDDAYQTARCGVDWIERILDEYGQDRWCLLIDADEVLSYPDDDRGSVGRLCDVLDRCGVNCLPTMSVDLYADESIVQTHLKSGQTYLDRCSYFDRAGYFKIPAPHQFPRLFGGVRARLFWPEVNLAEDVTWLERARRGDADAESWPETRYLDAHPDVRDAVLRGEFESGLAHYVRHGQHESRVFNPWPPCISQVPIVRWQRGMRYHLGRHELAGARWHWPDAVGGALLHFRLMADTAARARRAGTLHDGRREPGVWGEENERYARALEMAPGLSGMGPMSVRYSGPGQLVELGLLKRLDPI